MQLEVGMILYAESPFSRGDGVSSKHKITRVTPKMAFSLVRNGYELKFKRECKGPQFITTIGSEPSWNRTIYRLETEKLEEKHENDRTVEAYNY